MRTKDWIYIRLGAGITMNTISSSPILGKYHQHFLSLNQKHASESFSAQYSQHSMPNNKRRQEDEA